MLLPISCTGCISFESYIKPQHILPIGQLSLVVYLLNPTSNHNSVTSSSALIRVVYLLNPTSNHNFDMQFLQPFYVVYLLNPTSNHNHDRYVPGSVALYIF